MNAWLAYLAGVGTPILVVCLVVAFVEATAPVGYECMDCDWSTGGYRPALVAWLRRKWHVHVTRRLGRCHR